MANTDPRKIGILLIHMSARMLILALMAVRFIARLSTRRPAEASTGYPVLDRIAPMIILHRPGGSVGIAASTQIIPRSPHAASGRLLFFASIPVGLYRPHIVPGRRKYLRSQSESQAGGAGRSVLRDRRPAIGEASSGAAALSDARTAALARQARPEIPSSTGELAVQRTARRWGRDRGDRGRPRSCYLFAAGVSGGVGRPAQF